MDNVSGIVFNYQIIRTPLIKSSNIFAYAVHMQIIYKNVSFLIVEDLCIIDFIYQLSLYNKNLATYEYTPIDSENRILIFNKIDSENIEITSEWTNKRVIVNQEELINSIRLLKMDFEKKTKVKVNQYYQGGRNR